MRRLGTRSTTASFVALIGVAATLSLPAAAGPADGADVVVRPRSVASGDQFTVEVSGCTGGQRLQIQIDPAGLVAGAVCDGAQGAPGFAAVAFLAGGPLGEPGSHDVVVFESAQEIGRSSIEVIGPRGEDKRTAKTAVAGADDPVDAPPTTSLPRAAPEGPAAEPATSVSADPAAEPTTRVPEDPAAEPRDPAAEPRDSAAEPQERTVGTADPTTATAAVVDDDDDALADTGSGSSAPLAVLAALALVAGASLVALTRRTP